MTLRDPYCQRDSNDAQLRAHGCTLFSTLWLRRWASDGDEAPVAQGAIDKAVWGLQDDSGATKAQFLARGTTLDEAERAYEHDPFAGRTAPQMRKLHGGSIRDDLLPALRDGNVALVSVSYGIVVDAGRGVGSFRGGHAVVVGDPDDGTVAVVDPLRQQTVRWDIDLLVKAAEHFGKRPWLNGRGEVGIVVPSPTFLEVAKTQRDNARRALVKTQVELKGVNAKLEACEARPPVPTDPQAIADARKGGIKDAAAAAGAVT